MKVDCNNCHEDIIVYIAKRQFKSAGKVEDMTYDGNWNYSCLACNEWGECLDWSDPDIARVLDATEV